jgi:hypothetical protein
MNTNLISDTELFQIIQQESPLFCDKQKVNERFEKETNIKLQDVGGSYYTKVRPYYLKLLPSKL